MAFHWTAIRRAAAASGLAIGLCAAAMPAQAADDGYQNVFSSVLTAVGVMPPPRSPDIDYRERAPLVVPPKSALAAPVEARPLPASWPKDPDVIKRRKADAAARVPGENRFSKRDDGSISSKDELMQGRVDTPEQDSGSKTCGSFGNNDRNCLLLSPDELKRQGEAYEAANPDRKNEVTAGVEPERDYLTQPPKGYMKATRTVKATTEAPDQKIDESNPKASLYYRKKAEDE